MTFSYLSIKKVSNKKHRSVKRYTLLIRWLRVTVPLAIVTVLTLVFMHYGYHSNFTPEITESSANHAMHIENQLINPTLLSKDSKGQPLIIKAKKATQKEGKSLLESPESTVEFEKDKKMTITSHHAEYQEKEKILTYEENVKLNTFSGMIICSDKATVDLQSNTASSEKPVSGEGPQGTLNAEGFTWNDDVLTLKGKSKVVFN